MSFRWGRLPPMTRVADWNRLAQNSPTDSFRDAEIRKRLPNGLTLQEDEPTAAQTEQIVSMEPEKTDTAIGSLYTENVPLYTGVANVEKIVTKYDQKVIELEKAIKILAEEIREMERKEAESLRMDVPDVDKKEENTKAYKVEHNDNKNTKKKRRRKKKADKKGSKTEKDGGTKGSNDDTEKELDDRAKKLVAGALKAAAELEARLSVADVVKSTVKITQADHDANMMFTHGKVIIDNASKGAVNAMKMDTNKMDAKSKEIADDAIRAAVNDIKDERDQIFSMEPKRTDTAASYRYIEDIPLHMEVADDEKIVTKYDQEVIELEKAIKILAQEIREMEGKEAESLRMDVRGVDKKKEDTKEYKVETNGNTKKNKRRRRKKKEYKKGSKTEKEGSLKQRLDSDFRKADVDNDDKTEKELNEIAKKLVAGALKAVAEFEARPSVADVVKSAVKTTQANHEANMMSAHARAIVDNPTKGVANAMKMKKNEIDANAKEISDEAIRAAVNDMKDEKEKKEMEARAKGIVDAALKGAVKIMQFEKEKNEMKARAKGIVYAAIKGDVKAMQIEKDKNEMEAMANVIVDAALTGAVKVMHIEKEKHEMEARAKGIVDAALNGAVKVMQIEKEKNEMEAKAKGIVDAAIKGAVKVMQIEKEKKYMEARAKGIVDAALKGVVNAGVDNGNVLGAMLGQNGYDHRRIQVHVAPERFTEKERTDICQYWCEKLGMATTKNTKLHRDVIYFGRM